MMHTGRWRNREVWQRVYFPHYECRWALIKAFPGLSVQDELQLCSVLHSASLWCEHLNIHRCGYAAEYAGLACLLWRFCLCFMSSQIKGFGLSSLSTDELCTVYTVRCVGMYIYIYIWCVCACTHYTSQGCVAMVKMKCRVARKPLIGCGAMHGIVMHAVRWPMGCGLSQGCC